MGLYIYWFCMHELLFKSDCIVCDAHSYNLSQWKQLSSCWESLIF